MQALRDLEEVGVALRRVARGREPRQLPPHRVDVFAQVEGRAVVEEAAPLRVEADQVEVVLEPPPGLGEDAREHARHGEDGRPHVEAEAALVEHGRLAAEPGVLLEQGDR